MSLQKQTLREWWIHIINPSKHEAITPKWLPQRQSKSKSTTYHCRFETKIKLFASRKWNSLGLLLWLASNQYQSQTSLDLCLRSFIYLAEEQRTGPSIATTYMHGNFEGAISEAGSFGGCSTINDITLRPSSIHLFENHCQKKNLLRFFCQRKCFRSSEHTILQLLMLVVWWEHSPLYRDFTSDFNWFHFTPLEIWSGHRPERENAD